MSCQSFSEAPQGLFISQVSNRQRMKSHDRSADEADVCAGRIGLLVLPRVALQEMIEFVAATIKCIDRVIASEFFDARINALGRRQRIPIP